MENTFKYQSYFNSVNLLTQSLKTDGIRNLTSKGKNKKTQVNIMCCLWSSTNMFQIEIRFEFFLRVLAVGLFISCASSRYLRKYSWYVATFSPTRRKYYCVPSPNQSTRINRSERPLNVPLQDINLQTEIYRQTWAHISAPTTVLKLLY